MSNVAWLGLGLGPGLELGPVLGPGLELGPGLGPGLVLGFGLPEAPVAEAVALDPQALE